MITRVLLFALIAAAVASAHAVDIYKLSPMNETKTSADVELKGREVEAIEVALRQFRQDRFSTSGDLRHFTTELRREGSKLFVSFFPEYDEHSSRGGRNKFGTYITYAVSLRTLKIIGYHFERD